MTLYSQTHQNQIHPIFVLRVPMKEHSEAELVEHYRESGDNVYFQELYCRERHKVFAICLKYLRNTENAADATHEVFLKAYQNFSTLRGNHFSGWVCRIAANLCLNRIRDELTKQRLLSEPAPNYSIGGEERLIQAEELSIAKDIIETLRPEQRQVFLLKYLEGYSYQEIEKVTGYGDDQVRSYLQNARRNFQIQWEKRSLRKEQHG